VKPRMFDPDAVIDESGIAAPARQVNDRQVNPTPSLRMTLDDITLPPHTEVTAR
jgi:hypothetical protein